MYDTTDPDQARADHQKERGHACTECDGTGWAVWEPEPSLTTDLVVFAERCKYVLTVVRGDEPFAGQLALPGGYTIAGQPVAGSAFRELQEETGLDLRAPIDLVGVYDDPGRDPRGHVVSVAYWAAIPNRVPVVGADDAASAAWVPVKSVRETPMAFDHAIIVADAYRLWRASEGQRVYRGRTRLASQEPRWTAIRRAVRRWITTVAADNECGETAP